MTTPGEPAAAEGPAKRFVAFAGGVRIGEGSLSQAAAAARRAQDEAMDGAVLVFDRDTAEVVDLDLRGGEAEVVARYARPDGGAARRGRPKLGVVPREVTLLPRHWDWLARQPGGASVTLRRLVEAARRSDAGAARARADVAYRFMSAMAGDLPGFEEAARSLFAGQRERLDGLLAAWPADIADEIRRLAGG
ncbi:MAG: DUF2239 family protein [Proteobacteria bacterium]|nr:DUF2239 family protein [Pseudomonadota bacterium]